MEEHSITGPDCRLAETPDAKDAKIKELLQRNRWLRCKDRSVLEANKILVARDAAQLKEIESLKAEIHTWETTHIGMHYGSKLEADRMALLVAELDQWKKAGPFLTAHHYFDPPSTEETKS